jgi:hypothetical protein
VTGAHNPGANRAFADDAIIVAMLLNNAARRVESTVFGLTGLNRDESALITLLALAALAKTFGDATPTVKRPTRPSSVGVVVGGSLVKDAAHRIAGSGSRGVPGFVGLVAFALIWRYHPLARGSARVARGSVHAIEASERTIRRVYGGKPRS